MQQIAQQYGEQGPEEYNIKDSGHIPTEQFLQKLETQGGYSGNTPPNVIPEESMNEGAPMQVQKTFQQLRKKKMTRIEVDTADAKYKQTLRQLFKVKPTPVMQELDKDINELEEKVKNTPEAMMDDNLLYDEEKKNIEKRKNEARTKRDTKKLHRLEQEEMLLEQERMDNMRLAELQKLRLAAELEMIQQLEEQQREQEEIALAGAEYEYQNTARGRGVKAKAGEQLNRGLYEKQQREERGEPPLLISANTTKEDKRRHIRANRAERKRKRKEAQQEATALAVYNNKKEQYYKSAKLSPGAGPTNTLPLSLTHLDAYIQHI